MGPEIAIALPPLLSLLIFAALAYALRRSNQRLLNALPYSAALLVAAPLAFSLAEEGMPTFPIKVFWHWASILPALSAVVAVPFVLLHKPVSSADDPQARSFLAPALAGSAAATLAAVAVHAAFVTNFAKLAIFSASLGLAIGLPALLAVFLPRIGLPSLRAVPTAIISLSGLWICSGIGLYYSARTPTETPPPNFPWLVLPIVPIAATAVSALLLKGWKPTVRTLGTVGVAVLVSALVTGTTSAIVAGNSDDGDRSEEYLDYGL